MRRELQVQALLIILGKPPKVSVAVEEAEAALNRMKNVKAFGDDEITVGMIKVVGDTGVKWHHRLLRVCWDQARIPDGRRIGLTVPLWKGKGDAND